MCYCISFHHIACDHDEHHPGADEQDDAAGPAQVLVVFLEQGHTTVAFFAVPDAKLDTICCFLLIVVSLLLLFFFLLFDNSRPLLLLAQLALLLLHLLVHQSFETLRLSVEPLRHGSRASLI